MYVYIGSPTTCISGETSVAHREILTCLFLEWHGGNSIWTTLPGLLNVLVVFSDSIQCPLWIRKWRGTLHRKQRKESCTSCQRSYECAVDTELSKGCFKSAPNDSTGPLQFGGNQTMADPKSVHFILFQCYGLMISCQLSSYHQNWMC